MAFTGKLAGIDGLKLLFGPKGWYDEDGKFVEQKKLKKDESPPVGAALRHENEFTMSPEVVIKRGEWPDYDVLNRSDLGVGQTVKVCGVRADLPDGGTKAHTVVIEGEPLQKNRTYQMKMEADKLAAKEKTTGKHAKTTPAHSHAHK